MLQHSEWNWTYGRLGHVFVSPVFHRKHHSTDERQYNSNYSMLFTFWDDLFGTADRTSPAPTTYGLVDGHMNETFYGQVIYPFVLFGRGNGGSTTNTDDKGDGVTNPTPVCTTDGTSSGTICANHPATVADDDGGYLRTAAGGYFAAPVPLG